MRSRLLVFAALTLLLPVFHLSSVGAVDGTEPLTLVADASLPAGSPGLPYALSVEDDGSVLIADFGMHQVMRIALDGSMTTAAGGNGAGSAMNQLNTPFGVVAAPDGSFYVTEQGNHRVQRVAADGTVTTVAGGNGPGSAMNQLSTLTGIDIDDDGSLYIVDHGNSRIQKVDSDGAVTTVNASPSSALVGIRYVALGTDGIMFVSNSIDDSVLRVAADGTITTVAGGNGQGSAMNQLNDPEGIAVDAEGALYIADGGNHRVQRVAADGAVTTVAGGNGEGSAMNQLSYASGVFIDGNGSLYIADYWNGRVLKLTAFDTADPTVVITSPSAVVSTGTPTEVEFSCDDAGTSGLDTCTATLNGAPVTTGTAIDTNQTGPNTLIVTAVDGAGNTTVNNLMFSIEDPAPEYGPRELRPPWTGMSGLEGSVARLYMAVFNRQPDTGGHAYWVNRAQHGMSLREMARFFINSPEFADTYDDLSDSEFVELLYTNVMVRSADPSGAEFWNDRLADGTPRSAVVLQFSESPEFKDLTGTS